jgi:hypothetical protein
MVTLNQKKKNESRSRRRRDDSDDEINEDDENDPDEEDDKVNEMQDDHFNELAGHSEMILGQLATSDMNNLSRYDDMQRDLDQGRNSRYPDQSIVHLNDSFSHNPRASNRLG